VRALMSVARVVVFSGVDLACEGASCDVLARVPPSFTLIGQSVVFELIAMRLLRARVHC
jgi:hypothetical protein